MPKLRHYLILVELTSGRYLTPQTGESPARAKAKVEKRSDFVRLHGCQHISPRQFALASSKCPPLPKAQLFNPTVSRR